jgi:hypothetical protein
VNVAVIDVVTVTVSDAAEDAELSAGSDPSWVSDWRSSFVMMLPGPCGMNSSGPSSPTRYGAPPSTGPPAAWAPAGEPLLPDVAAAVDCATDAAWAAPVPLRPIRELTALAALLTAFTMSSMGPAMSL